VYFCCLEFFARCEYLLAPAKQRRGKGLRERRDFGAAFQLARCFWFRFGGGSAAVGKTRRRKANHFCVRVRIGCLGPELLRIYQMGVRALA
jgi:hypothetical protein